MRLLFLVGKIAFIIPRKDELSVCKYYVILIYLQFSSIMGLEKERGLEENEGRF